MEYRQRRLMAVLSGPSAYPNTPLSESNKRTYSHYPLEAEFSHRSGYGCGQKGHRLFLCG
jgi:hypothetical protein